MKNHSFSNIHSLSKNGKSIGHVAVNPGSGPVEGGTLENATINMHAFLKDCREKGAKVSGELGIVGHGLGDRYVFHLVCDECPEAKFEVQMPGLPLNEVRYMGEEGQNIWDYPRLYVDGDSGVWCYCLITPEDVREKIKGPMQIDFRYTADDVLKNVQGALKNVQGAWNEAKRIMDETHNTDLMNIIMYLNGARMQLECIRDYGLKGSGKGMDDECTCKK